MAHNFDLRIDPVARSAQIVIHSRSVSDDGTISITRQCAQESELQWEVGRLKKELDEVLSLAKKRFAKLV